MILHRPPQHLFSEPSVSTSEDVEICQESLQALCRLLRSYARQYHYHHLPLDFVHTLSTAASVILMERYFNSTAPMPETTPSRATVLIQEAMESVKDTHPCISEIMESFERATRPQPSTIPDLNPLMGSGLMDWSFADFPASALNGEAGLFLTDEALEGMKEATGNQ